jgi:hypothetical protein
MRSWSSRGNGSRQVLTIFDFVVDCGSRSGLQVAGLFRARVHHDGDRLILAGDFVRQDQLVSVD